MLFLQPTKCICVPINKNKQTINSLKWYIIYYKVWHNLEMYLMFIENGLGVKLYSIVLYCIVSKYIDYSSKLAMYNIYIN